MRESQGVVRLGREYWTLWVAQAISVSGSTFQGIALPLWILDVTGSAVATGAAFAMEMLPVVFFAPLGGKVADAYNRRRLFILAECLSTLAVLGLLVSTSMSVVVGSLTMLFLLRAVSCFAQPALQGLIRDLVPDNAVGPAFSKFEGVGGVAVVLGPLVGAAIYSVSGITAILWINGVSFALGALLVLVGLQSRDPSALVAPVLKWTDATPIGLAALAREVLKAKPLRALLSIEVAYFALFGGATAVAVTLSNLQVSAQFAGIFLSVVGVAMLTVTMFVLPRVPADNASVLALGLLLVPVSCLGLWLPFGGLVLGLVWLAALDGLANGVILARCTVIWQRSLNSDQVGRAMALRRAAINAAGAVSALLLPAVAGAMGATAALTIFSVLTAIVGLAAYGKFVSVRRFHALDAS